MTKRSPLYRALGTCALSSLFLAAAIAQPPGGRPGGDRPGGGGQPNRPSPGGRPQRPAPAKPNPGRPNPGKPGGGRPNPGGGNRPSPGRPNPGRPNPGRPNPGRPNPGRPNPGRPGAGRPGGGHGRPPSWGRPPRNRPSYHFRPNDRGFLLRFYASNLAAINRASRPRFAVGGYFPYGDIGYLQPVPPSAYGMLPPPPPGYEMGYYDGYVVVYDPVTYFIADLIDLM